VKEATAHIKINKLLEGSGWRFFAEGNLPADIQLEPSVTIKSKDLDALGEDFQKVEKGFIDFLLLNEKGFPFIVLDAKAENKSPLVGKEQAIVAEIEAEQALVATNRDLIARFEKRIQATLARVWGEETAP